MSILKIDDDENICVRALREYLALHEKLDDRHIVLMPKFFDARARYQAPLIECQGKEAIGRFWAERRASYKSYRLKVRHQWWDEEAQTGFAHWEFMGKRKGRTVSFTGYGEITFTPQGKILSHIDTYDPFAGVTGWKKTLAQSVFK